MRLAYPTHHQPAHITTGTGSVRTVAAQPMDASTVIFLSAQATVRATVEASLAKAGGAGLDASPVIVKPAGEPTAETVETGAAFLRMHPATRIIAIGGGSVLDWCRLSLARSCEALDLSTGAITAPARLAARPALWLVPTTFATGAEAAGVAVYLNGDRKIPVVTPAFIADQVILDGQFLKHAEPHRVGLSCADAMTHAVEAFVSIVPGTFAKEAAVSAARLLLANGTADAGPSRNERLMEAGFLGGVAAANCSVGVVHAFSHSVAALGVPHAFGNAVALDAGMAVNAEAEALTDLSRRLGLSSVDGLRDKVTSLVAAARDDRARHLLARALSSESSRRAIAVRMAADVCMRSNPVRLSPAGVDQFLDAVLVRLESTDPGSGRPRSAAEESDVPA